MHHRITNPLTMKHNDPFLNTACIIFFFVLFCLFCFVLFFLGMNSLSSEKGGRAVDPLSYKHVTTIASSF